MKVYPQWFGIVIEKRGKIIKFLEEIVLVNENAGFIVIVQPVSYSFE